MKRLLMALLFIASWATPQAWAASGTITTNASTCALSTTCLVVSMSQDKGGATLTLSGTWTGTISFEASGDGGTTWSAVNCFALSATSAVTSATGNGTWQVNTAGFTGLRMRGSATMSGAALATINLSFAAARNNGGTNSGGGITNAASANVVMKSDGTNGVGSSISDNGTSITVTEPITPAVAAAKNLGTAPLPFGDLFVGGAANHSFHFDTSAVVSNVAIAIPNHASNPVQGIANPSDSSVINYIGTDGVQNRIALGTGQAGNSVCWKTATTLSYCTTVVASDGTCTCH